MANRSHIKQVRTPKQPEIGTHVIVDGDSIEAVNKALERLKRKMKAHGVFDDLRKHEHFVPKSVAKRTKSQKARSRKISDKKRAAKYTPHPFWDR